MSPGCMAHYSMVLAHGWLDGRSVHDAVPITLNLCLWCRSFLVTVFDWVFMSVDTSLSSRAAGQKYHRAQFTQVALPPRHSPSTVKVISRITDRTLVYLKYIIKNCSYALVETLQESQIETSFIIDIDFYIKRKGGVHDQKSMAACSKQRQT